MSVVGLSPTDFPEEPKNGIELGEEFSYEINVYKGVMYLAFTREGLSLEEIILFSQYQSLELER